ELLEAVRAFLEEEVVPALDGPRQFHARVAANVLAIVGRELAGEEASLLAEWGRLAGLLGRPSEPPPRLEALRAAVRDGTAALAGGDEVVPPLNAYVAAFVRAGLPIFATRDWHPPNHCSFRTRGGPWPPHCVAGSEGARFAPGLALPPSTVVVSKDTLPEQDTYSGFQGGDLDARLREAGVRRVFVGGL